MRKLFPVFLFSFAAVVFTASASAQVVALGASNTEGFNVGPAAAFPAQLELLLKAKGRDVKVVNAGIAGDTTRGMLARLDKWISGDTRVVVLQYGGNDLLFGIPPEQTKTNIAEIQRMLEAHKIRLVVVNAHIAEAVNAGLKQADQVHLDAAGHKQVAEKLLPEVLAALE